MINATKEKLTTYFQGTGQFVVPFFQRGYVWDEDNWTTFWEHISEVLERAAKNYCVETFKDKLPSSARFLELFLQQSPHILNLYINLTYSTMSKPDTFEPIMT